MAEVTWGHRVSCPFVSEWHADRSFLFAMLGGGRFELIEQTAYLVKFCGRRLATGQRVQDQFGSRAPKCPLDQIVNQLLLRLGARDGGSIEMRAAADIPPHETFFGHDLKQLQDRGVSDGPPFANEPFVNVSHRARLMVPQHPKDF